MESTLDPAPVSVKLGVPAFSKPNEPSEALREAAKAAVRDLPAEIGRWRARLRAASLAKPRRVRSRDRGFRERTTPLLT